ncbi:unnamed protein product [Notodromas monacha]|uniref:AMP-dependent synthetase/ligase domain-containing protein n=1 Tax=Notodromas monacha TaxID=399045 RepID=A0A7R9BFC5_9CRUS|nr:unnamed protein product [Notodromas monacha]CAG0913070.1 unnamed protein product [Notodromas monacha]
MNEDGIVSSPFPKVSDKLAEGRDLWEFIQERIKQVIRNNGDKPMWIDGIADKSITYAQFLDRVEKMAHFFSQTLEMKRGSKLIMSCCGDVNFFVVVFAAVALGILVFSIPSYALECIPICLREDAGIKVIVCDEDNVSNITELLASAETNSRETGEQIESPKVFLIEGDHPIYENIPSILQSSALAETNDDRINYPEIDDGDEDCVVFFSSGSTGVPKPIVHTRANMLSIAFNVSDNWVSKEKESEVKLSTFNQGHAGGFIMFILNLTAASTLVGVSKPTPENILRAIEKYQTTAVNIYPKQAILISKMDNLHSFNLSSVKELSSSAATFPNSIIPTLKTVFFNVKRPVEQLYGSTETLCISSSTGIGADENEAGVGHLLPYAQLKVIDVRSNKALGPNQPGEILIRHKFRFKEYRHRSKLTAESLAEDGWFLMGDYGFYDENGRLHILDRVKELINLPDDRIVSPSHIEDITLRHPAVKLVGVSGIPSIEGGSLPRAFVVPLSYHNSIEAWEIVTFVSAQAGESSHLHLIGGAEVVPEGMEITSLAGKIYRTKLQQLYLSRLQRNATDS